MHGQAGHDEGSNTMGRTNGCRSRPILYSDTDRCAASSVSHGVFELEWPNIDGDTDGIDESSVSHIVNKIKSLADERDRP